MTSLREAVSPSSSVQFSDLTASASSAGVAARSGTMRLTLSLFTE